MSDQYVPDDERDAILDRLLQIPENKVCFDCKSKNPKWASSNIGIFLCYQCTSVHRNLGVHISFVRSLKMDRWKPKEIKQMELGGNKNAQIYFEKNGMYVDGKPNHKATQLTKYKQDLLKKVEIALGQSLQHQGSAVFNMSKPDDTNGITVTGNGSIKFSSDNIFETSNAMNSLQLGRDNSSPTFSKKQESQAASSQFEERKTTSLILNKPSNSSSLVQQQPSFTGFSGIQLGGGVKPQADVKTLNAKKIDVNFDNDDFFNSFEPSKPQQNINATNKTVSLGAPNSGTDFASSNGKFVTKLQEVDDQFDIFPKATNNSTTTKPDQSSFTFGKQVSFGGSGGQQQTQQYTQPENEYEAKQRLQQLGNKKGISSEDIFGKQEVKSEEVKQKYQQLAGQKAISSDMFFGNQGGRSSGGKDLGDEVEGYLMGRSSQSSNRSYDEYKEQAARIAEQVTENAKILKGKALDWLSSFTQN